MKAKKYIAAFVALMIAALALPSPAVASHDNECDENGITREFRAAYDAAPDADGRIKAMRGEAARQRKWIDAYADTEGMSAERAKALRESQAAWDKWMALEKKFLETIETDQNAVEDDEYWIMCETVSRVLLLREHTVGEEAEVTFEGPVAVNMAITRDGFEREPDGTTKRFGAELDEWIGDAASLAEILTRENELQDKWLNADYKALREILNDKQKTALRDAQRAWLKLRDADSGFIYDPEGGTMTRDAANFELTSKLVHRTARLEYLLSRIRAERAR